jgi:NADH-quinone oxidoreductase subunit N
MGGALGPVVALGGGAVLVLLLDLLWEGAEALLRAVALVVLALAAWAVLGAGPGTPFPSLLRWDELARLADGLAVAGAAAAVLLRAREGWGRRWSAYLALVLWAAAGMALAGAAESLVVLFLGVEVLSLALYALTAFASAADPERGELGDQGRGVEGGLKYFVLGGLGSALLLYGAALAYAATGSLSLAALGGPGTLGALGLLLVVAGLGFKLALAPFQLWTPDAYAAAPTSVTAFMAVGTKAAAFVALARVLEAAAARSGAWLPVLAVLGVASMFVGYLAALRQSDLKRLLAYSGVANAGTIALALTVPGVWRPVAAVYLVAYAAGTLAAFAAVVGLEAAGSEPGLGALRGLAGRHPWTAAALFLGLLSLAAVPPTGGFLGKLLLLRELAGGGHPVLAALVAVASLVALYPYFRLAQEALAPGPEGAVVRPQPGWVAVALVAALGTLAVGLLPGPLLRF